jgi:hypothetical protein
LNGERQNKLGVRRIAWSLKNASEMLGVSVGHLRNEHKRGRLLLVKSGSRTLVTDEELERYLAENSRPAAQSPMS